VIAETNLLSPTTTADVLRVTACLLGGVSLGMTIVIVSRLKVLWTRLDLLVAKIFIVIHSLVVLFVFGTLAERAGEPLGWKTPIALVIFSLKITVLMVLRYRIAHHDMQQNPPHRRVGDC
jgi:hypothetical protein